MYPMGFETTIPAGERLKIYALDRAATGTDIFNVVSTANKILIFCFLQEASALTHSERDRK